MNFLKDAKCSRCGGKIAVIPYTEKNKYGIYETVVDCGRCIYCDKGVVLPCENYREFVREFCE